MVLYGMVLETHDYYHRALDRINDEGVTIEYIRHPADVCNLFKIEIP